jgi:hypothetical protein
MMNNIILNKPEYINKKYVVFLDSENKFSFPSKRKAEDFIVHIEKVINQAILFITEEFNSLEEFYRLYYLADKDYKFKFLISNIVDFISNRLEWMHTHEGSRNHDTILFHAVIACIEELKSGFAIMYKKAAARKDTITKRRCELKEHLLDIFQESLLLTGIKPEEVQFRVKTNEK